MRALLVEDDEAIALIVKTLLVREGWEVHVAVDAETALLQDGVTDLLVTDYNLPGLLNGQLLARELRERNPALAVVVMSGEFDGGEVTDGNIVLLAKPFRKNALLEAIDRARNAIRT